MQHDVINTTDHLKHIPFIHKRYCMARKQATSNFFGRNKYNIIYLLPFTEPLKCPMKPTPKDEECTY